MFKRKQGRLAKAKVFTTYEMSEIHNEKYVIYGYSVGSPPTEPPRQDWPMTIFYTDCPRNEMAAFYAAQTVTGPNMPGAGPSDRVTTTEFLNQHLINNQGIGTTDYDFICYLRGYYSHHRIYNPNNHPMWAKIFVIAPAFGKTPTSDPAGIIASYLGGQYNSMSVIQFDQDTAALSTSNIDWKNLDTTANTILGGSIHGLYPVDKTWAARARWRTISSRKKVLIPAGGVFKFRLWHKGFGPIPIAEYATASGNPWCWTDRIVKVQAMSTIGMTPYAADSTSDRLHSDFVTFGIWVHNIKTLKTLVLNKPVFINSMSTAQKATAVIDPSVQPGITVSQQVMGPNPA